MSLTYKDVALVNTSLRDLGDSLLQNRMLKMRAGENAAARAEHQKDREARLAEEMQRTARDEAQFKGQQEHWKKTEEGQAAANARQMSRDEMTAQTALMKVAIDMNNSGVPTETINAWMQMQPNFKGTNLTFTKPTEIKPPSGTTLSDVMAAEEFYMKMLPQAVDPETKDRYTLNLQLLDQFKRQFAAQANQPKPAPGLQKQVTTRTPGGGETMLKGPADLVDAEAAKAQPGGGAGKVAMIDKDGNQVLVPAARVKEMIGKGYQAAQ